MPRRKRHGNHPASAGPGRPGTGLVSLDDFLDAQDHLPCPAVHNEVRLIIRVVPVPQVDKLLPSAFKPELHFRHLHANRRKGDSTDPKKNS